MGDRLAVEFGQIEQVQVQGTKLVDERRTWRHSQSQSITVMNDHAAPTAWQTRMLVRRIEASLRCTSGIMRV